MILGVNRLLSGTSTGNQDSTTTDLGGATPKAVFSIASKADTDGTPRGDSVISFGAADGTRQWAACTVSDNGQASTNNSRRGMTDECIMFEFPAGAVDGEAAFNSFIANGVRRTWGDAPGSTQFITDMFFAGDDVQAYAGTLEPGTTVDATVNVTGLGFLPKFILFGSVGDNLGDSSSAFFHASFGIAVNDGSETQRCWIQAESDNQAAGSPESILSTNYVAGQLTSGSLDYGVEVSGFNSDGFDVVLRVGSGGTDKIGFLALTGNINVWLGTHDMPTSTGNQTSTAPGIEPISMIVGLTTLQSVDTVSAAAPGGSVGVGVVGENGTEFCTAWSIENAADPTDTQSLSDDTVVNLPEDDGTTGYTAAHSSFNTDGWTWNFSAALGVATKSFVLAIGNNQKTIIPMLEEDNEMKYIIEAGAVDQSINVFIRDSSTGQGKTGLAYDSAGVSCYYNRPRAAATQLVLATLASATAVHSDGGFKEIDATNKPGEYRLDLSDAVIAAGADWVSVELQFDGTFDTVVNISLNVASSTDVADAVADEVYEGTLTLRQIVRVFLSALGGKSSGGGTTNVKFRDNADTKDRIDATVDANGNRTAISIDGT